MEIWLDSLDTDVIIKATKLGLLHGVTTNPSIIADSRIPLESILDELLSVQTGPVAVQVTAEYTSGQVVQAKHIAAVSSRLIVKVPVTAEGLLTIRELNELGIPTMATAVFHPKQVLTAALAGASYVAPYIRGIHDYVGKEPFEMLTTMQSLIDRYGFSIKILAASLRNAEDVVRCTQVGIAAVTLKVPVFDELIADNDATLHFVDRFASDWKHAHHTNLLH